MCGICGQFTFGTLNRVSPETIARMTSTICHRGPDDEGYYLSGPIGLGFRRLSIIDLGGGHQPMADGNHTIWVLFNGGIYNFPRLKSERETFAHCSPTKSHTAL